MGTPRVRRRLRVEALCSLALDREIDRMRLPILKMRVLPDLRCMRCGQRGYVEEKSTLCLACFNISLLRFGKLRMAR